MLAISHQQELIPTDVQISSLIVNIYVQKQKKEHKIIKPHRNMSTF